MAMPEVRGGATGRGLPFSFPQYPGTLRAADLLVGLARAFSPGTAMPGETKARQDNQQAARTTGK